MEKRSISFTKIIFLLSAFFLIINSSYSAKRYWRGNGSSVNWNATANWSSTSGGTTGVSVPAAHDTVYFDGNGTGQCSINATVSVYLFTMSAGYTDTVKQNGNAITSATGMLLSGGTFWGGTTTITDQGPFTLSGTTFKSTSGSLVILGNYTFSSGTFSHNNGTVAINATSTMSGSTDFYNLQFNPTATNSIYTLDTLSIFNVLHLFTHSGNRQITINRGKLNIQGDITVSNTNGGTSGTGTLEINGTGTQNINGYTDSTKYNLGLLCNVEINKSSGTLYLKNTIVLGGSLTYTAGTVDATTYNSTLSFILGNHTITGNLTINNLILGVYSSFGTNLFVDPSFVLTVNGWFKITAGNDIDMYGKIDLKGDFITYSTSPYTSAGGSGTLRFMGTGDQLMAGKTTAGYGRLCSIKIDKPSGTLYLKDHIRVGGNWTYVQGTVDATTYNSTVDFANGAKKISGKQTLNNVSFDGAGYFTYDTIPLADTLTVLGNMNYQGIGQGIIFSTGVVNIKGDLVITNDYTGVIVGDGTLLFSGTGTQTIVGNVTGIGRLPNIKINKPSGTLYIKDIVTIGYNSSWKLLNGITDATTYGSTVIFLYGTRTIQGTQAFDKLIFDAAASGTSNTITSTDTITIAGEFQVKGTTGVFINSGFLKAQGDITITNTSTSVSTSSALLTVCGTGNQTITGSGISGTGRLCNVKINKPSGTLLLSSIISLAGSWNYVQGTVSAGTSTATFANNVNVNGKGTSATMNFNNVTIYNLTTTLTGTLSVLGNVTINSIATLNGNGKNIYVGGNWDNTGTFTYAATNVNFNGAGRQRIIKPSGTINFDTITVNKSAQKLLLGVPIVINKKLYLTEGAIGTTSTNLLSMPDNAILSGGSDSGYVCGPMKKTGNDAFTFPLGDTLLSGAYHPLHMTAPSSTTDAYTAQYYSIAQTYGSTIQTDSLDSISSCEYWLLTRNAGSSTVIPSLGWNSNSTNIYGNYDICVAGWNGSQWNTLGKSSATYGVSKGVVSALIGLSASALPLVIANPISKKPTSECVLKKKLDAGYYTLRNGYLRFKFDEEYVSNGNELEFKIYDKYRNVVVSNTSPSVALNIVYKDNRWGLNVLAVNPALAAGYYVLEVKDRKGEISMLRFKI